MIKMKDFIIIKNVLLVSTKENKNLIDIPDLQFDKNSISVIMGHNGSGKTLLLNLLQGLITPNSGSIRFNPKIKNCKNFISIMMQKPTFLRRTTQQNIQFILDLNKNKTRISFLEVLKRFDLVPQKNILANKLSGGEKQRLSLALATSINSKILFLSST